MRLMTLLLVLWTMAALQAGPAAAQSNREQRQQELVDRATLTVQDMLGGEQGRSPRDLLAHARGVMICPSVFRMSFFFGGSGGGCVLLTRDAAGGRGAAGVYTVGAGRVGRAAGGQGASSRSAPTRRSPSPRWASASRAPPPRRCAPTSSRWNGARACLPASRCRAAS